MFPRHTIHAHHEDAVGNSGSFYPSTFWRRVGACINNEAAAARSTKGHERQREGCGLGSVGSLHGKSVA
eukprot:scaffold187477_cov32-Tisochrysis_lutea.AAC.1